MDIKLVMFKSNGPRKDIPVSGDSIVLGRGEDCGLQIPLLAVSRNHCELSIEEDVLSVKDLGSANGTLVNGERVDEGQLNAGDRLTVGPVTFTVQIDGQPGQIEPVQPATPAAADDSGIVDLPADAIDDFIGLGDADDDDDDLDPIAALEALAAENDDDEDGKV